MFSSGGEVGDNTLPEGKISNSQRSRRGGGGRENIIHKEEKVMLIFRIKRR